MIEPEEFGEYLVYEKLGVGGMASVHRANKADGSGQPVALKRLHPQLAQVDEFVQAFLDEANLAVKLQHDNIARTYDVGLVDETYFIAMELVRGPTLSQIMNHCWTVKREIPIPITVYIVTQLLDALDYAHHLTDDGKPLGIIHRDVTPSNIIVSTAGVAKLIDFGIAKAASSSVRTKTGFIKGKFAYVAPEYIEGKIDSRVDLFAAGILAHELLAHRKLFQVDNDFETLKRVQSLAIERPSKWNPRVPAAVDDVVMTALRRDPEQRWQRASAMREALTKVAKKMPNSMQVAGWIEEAMGPAERSDASAVSIEISLIEDGYTKIAFGMQEVENTRNTHIALILAAVFVVASAVIAYFIVR
ncbi:MAG: serine/threonine protein kinase [Deltaproteobacteria bacterium]|nr:serine/threonine protein kinase [Deltaproteobacteria bacterium]